MFNLLPDWAEKTPNHPALFTPDKSFTWSELEAYVRNIRWNLLRQGIEKNDVIALVSRNCPDLVFIYLALLEIGAVPAFVLPQPLVQLERKFRVIECSHVWWGKDSRKNFSDSELERAALHHEVVIKTNAPKGRVSEHNVSQSEPLASIVFTSGTTGEPKAVAHTAEQHEASANGLLEQLKFEQSDCWLLSLPVYHVSGLAIVWRWLYSGAQMKIGLGEHLSTDLEGVTHASLVATQLKRLLDSGSNLSLKRVLLGGSHIPTELTQRANQRGIETWVGYGMTEAASTVMAKRANSSGGVGYLLSGREIKLQGERIFIGGKTLAEGYYRRGKLTALSADGWFDSKDLGVWCGEELKVIGRADNLFISGGENIHCEEIEAVLNQHPSVVQAIILPVENKEFGHRPVALIQSDIAVEELKLAEWLADKLVKFKIPDAFYGMPELSNGSIKVSRSELKRWYEGELQLTD
ncbi:o-succinylbenzoate--CoA ligase [Vibrio hannami]|uniref:o-succinylbenzoate--CoA ligase n=1 Tax=Vibrio hannami TaxID=2717094 RepID=UPI0024103E84|nr:o-succinylbenzoate--CoA ligase [Vibrio hannami]MDG3087563.1 o-succinylbenzoate--CoA ligase [Vibrio hannami]